MPDARYGMRVLKPIAAIAALAALIAWSADAFFQGLREYSGHPRIFIYGFSILGEPLRERIFPAFREKWRRETGEDVEFVDSFAASGTVANQVVMGAPADVAILSHPDDADRIAAAGMARRPWRSLPHGGVLNRTPIVFVVRPGNPLGVRSFADLTRPDVKIVHPDPLTSGGAQWAIFAEYGSGLVEARETRSPADAERRAYEQLLGIWRNVVTQAPSARAAKTQFDTGFGDALVTYEVEAILDARRGKEIDYALPPSTILTEHCVVAVDRNIGDLERPAVEAFVRYLWSEEAQRAFAEYGYRSVLPGIDEAAGLRPVERPFTIATLGGWRNAKREITEGIWRGRVLRELRP